MFQLLPRQLNTFWILFRRVGIIGEPMSGFNPLTLIPFGEEHEEETGDEDESRRR